MFGINDSGQVVGYNHFLYSRGTFTTVADPCANGGAHPFAINHNSDIAGYHDGTNSRYLDYGSHGFLYSHGVFRGFDVDGQMSDTAIYGLNNRGEVVGTYVNASGATVSFVSDGAKTKTIAVPDARQTYAYGINDRGCIVGYYQTASGDHCFGFLLVAGKYTTLAFPGARQTFANSVNNASEVAGNYYDADGNSHGFLYSNGEYIPMDIPGALQTVVWGINNKGQISGYYDDASSPYGTVGFLATIQTQAEPSLQP